MQLSCIICSDLFAASDYIQATQCGHIFHNTCLLRWIERSKTCPQCRNKCTHNTIHRIYFNIANLDTSNIDLGSLQQKLEAAELKAAEKDKELLKANDSVTDLKKIHKMSLKTISILEKKIKESSFTINSYQEQIKILKTNHLEIEKQRKEILCLKEQFKLFTTIQSVISSTASEVDSMMKENSNSKTLNTCIAVLKRELKACETKKLEINNQLKDSQNSAKIQRDLNRKLEEKIAILESENYRMTSLLKTMDISSTKCDSDDDRTDFLGFETPEKEELVVKTGLIKNKNLKRLKKDTASPYIKIKSSSIGLVPLLKRIPKESIQNKSDLNAAVKLSSLRSDVSEKYSIFQRPRLMLQSAAQSKDTAFTFNGLGTSEKKENSNFPIRKSFSEERPSSSSGAVARKLQSQPKSILSVRLKNGDLKNPLSSRAGRK